MGYICQLVHRSMEEKIEKNWCETDKKTNNCESKDKRAFGDNARRGWPR